MIPVPIPDNGYDYRGFLQGKYANLYLFIDDICVAMEYSPDDTENMKGKMLSTEYALPVLYYGYFEDPEQTYICYVDLLNAPVLFDKR